MKIKSIAGRYGLLISTTASSGLIQQIADCDLNDLMSNDSPLGPTLYRVDPTNVQNLPYRSDSWGVVYSFKTGNTSGFQLFLDSYRDEIFIRRYTSGWQPWKQVSLSELGGGGSKPLTAFRRCLVCVKSRLLWGPLVLLISRLMGLCQSIKLTLMTSRLPEFSWHLVEPQITCQRIRPVLLRIWHSTPGTCSGLMPLQTTLTFMLSGAGYEDTVRSKSNGQPGIGCRCQHWIPEAAMGGVSHA